MSLIPPDAVQVADHALGALYATVTDNTMLLNVSLTGIGEYGRTGWWMATCAWAEAIQQCTPERLDAVDVEGDASTPQAAPALLAARVVACVGNRDHETAYALWLAVDPVTALRASRIVLESAAVMARERMESRP